MDALAVRILCALVPALLPLCARAWLEEGHRRVADLAIELARRDLPPFFAEGKGQVIHCACDPDLFAARKGTPLRAQERPEHYIDMEFLGRSPLPSNRVDYVALCAAKGLRPADVGYAPYAVREWFERLVVSLAEHRKSPAGEFAQRKALVYAGILAHYSGDLCMPLHTTVHFDGRAGKDGKSPRSGIHVKVDALAGKLHESSGSILHGLLVPRISDPWLAIVQQVKESRSRVDALYDLESKLPGVRDPLPPDGEVYELARERLRRASTFTAALFVAAWERSAGKVLPGWHQIPRRDGAD